MNFYQISRLVRLYERAEQHSNEYKKLVGNCSAQSKALRHLRKAEQLRSKISRLIRDLTPAETWSGSRSPGLKLSDTLKNYWDL